MVSEQTSVDVAASSEELRTGGTLGISDHIDREHEGDSRGDADRSTMQSSAVRQQALLPTRKAPFRRSSPASAISDDTLDSLMAFGNELKKIRHRLISEGYVIDGTRIYKPNENDFKN